MAENKKSFLLYVDQRNLFHALTDEEAGKLIKHIYDYVSDLNLIQLIGLLKLLLSQ